MAGVQVYSVQRGGLVTGYLQLRHRHGSNLSQLVVAPQSQDSQEPEWGGLWYCEAAYNDDDKTHVIVILAAAAGRTIENIGWIIILVISSRPVTGF